jgi:hypothetical protein
VIFILTMNKIFIGTPEGMRGSNCVFGVMQQVGAESKVFL